MVADARHNGHHEAAARGNSPPDFDRNGLEIIPRHECLDLLRQHAIGRIGLSWDALPVVLPVNYVLDGEQIVLRTAPGTKFSAALANTVVAFEIDGHDPVGHTGWSVLVRGTARWITDPVEIDEARKLQLQPWAHDAGDRFVALQCELISGRRAREWYPNQVTSDHGRATAHGR